MEALSVQDPNFNKIKPDVIQPENMLKAETSDIIPRPDWEKYCSQVALRILSEQSPDRLLEVRGMLYELLVHCIPANTIIFVSELMFDIWSKQHHRLSSTINAVLTCHRPFRSESWIVSMNR